MDEAKLYQKLISAARAHAPSAEVPYGFERRIMSRLVRVPVGDILALWSRALWRAAACCLTVLVLVSAWAAFTPRHGAASGDLSQDFENTLLASVDQPED